jgi:hypothetical protein
MNREFVKIHEKNQFFSKNIVNSFYRFNNDDNIKMFNLKYEYRNISLIITTFLFDYHNTFLQLSQHLSSNKIALKKLAVLAVSKTHDFKKVCEV